MYWTAISTVIELLGVVVVIVTLWYLAVQIRENTRATLAASRQGLIDSELGLLSDYIDHAIDPHFITDDMPLSPEDERRFTWIVVKALRIREFAWHQYQSGSLDEASWQSYMGPVPGIFATERAKAILRFYIGSPDFMRVLPSGWPRQGRRPRRRSGRPRPLPDAVAAPRAHIGGSMTSSRRSDDTM